MEAEVKGMKRKADLLKKTAALLSVPEGHTLQTIERFLKDSEDMEKRIEKLKKHSDI